MVYIDMIVLEVRMDGVSSLVSLLHICFVLTHTHTTMTDAIMPVYTLGRRARISSQVNESSRRGKRICTSKEETAVILLRGKRRDLQ